MVTEHCFNPSILKRFFFSVKYFSRYAEDHRQWLTLEGLPLVINIVLVWKKQLCFCQFKCLDVDLRKADNVTANSRKYLTH